ncbi:uncharacterized protein LOC106011164 [Aplysia californica]|uniref:Uncharacterized protein LOC106011164 n=1 Tax=Aplysia californica TaxID=6500 RepID=A0ABM0ZVD3_APLCA|nr:uncharacterized protein LOC106011164 [Aplysia californica]
MKWSPAAVCLLVLFVTGHGKPPKCPPAEEGQPYNITHSTSIRHNLRDLYWRFQLPSGKHEEVSYCYHDDETICYDLWHEYTAHRRLDGDAVTCHLEMSRVSNQHRGVVVEFVATNASVGLSYILFACEMEVYLMPQDSHCHAVEVAPKLVEVTCKTSKVYPQASCELSQVELSSQYSEKINPSLIDHSHTQTKEDGALYFSETWKISAPVSRAGKHVFFAKITPTLSTGTKEDILIKPVNTPPIDVTARDRIVRLLSPKSTFNICGSGGNTIFAACEALGFKSQTRFYWKKGHSSLHQAHYTSDSIGSKYLESYMLYNSRFEFNVTEVDHNTLLTCVADETDSRYQLEKPLQAESKLSLRWPPRTEPKFMTSYGEEITASSISSFHDASDPVTCLVEGGNPPVSHTSVTCDRLNRSKVKEEKGQVQRRQFAEDANSVKFRLTGVPGESYKCTCVASHQTECYHKHRNLIVNLVQNGKIQGSAKKWNTSFLFIVVFLVIFVVIFSFTLIATRTQICKSMYSPKTFRSQRLTASPLHAEDPISIPLYEKIT